MWSVSVYRSVQQLNYRLEYNCERFGQRAYCEATVLRGLDISLEHRANGHFNDVLCSVFVISHHFEEPYIVLAIFGVAKLGHIRRSIRVLSSTGTGCEGSNGAEGRTGRGCEEPDGIYHVLSRMAHGMCIESGVGLGSSGGQAPISVKRRRMRGTSS